VEVTVAKFPIGILEPCHRLHLHVDRQEIVTTVSPVLDDIRDEERRIDSLPMKPAVVIRECHDDRIDVIRSDQGIQALDIQHPAFQGHGGAQSVALPKNTSDVGSPSTVYWRTLYSLRIPTGHSSPIGA
jgi:hypothetical protein